ncbi:unnamed protein product [Leptidea sinapis]|uniref:Uncharacterized protein n=1 Tax=Leptidea sinapis TaxID=189913 RepID=A0A5E4Q997_9NEOP|nr:unnamed protein product [Leptidea sinapis]
MVVWTSFHRTLFLQDVEVWLSKQVRQYKWPLEFYLYGDNCSYSFMGFIDLFKLLYNGDTKSMQCLLKWKLYRVRESAPAAVRTTDFCTINRQLGGTRTRVEMHTSFWQEAAVYVNNQFVEMTLMAHALLMRLVSDFFSTADTMVSKNMDDANLWRELSTCLRDLDSNWAEVCLNKSLSINPRHPLSILAKGCSVFESNPDEAEPFFVCLLRLYPFYRPLWVVASAYYWRQEHFNMANDIITYVREQALAEDMKQPRVWEHELGDWWDPTPLLPGTSPFYDACDLLLRIRAISLAEICLARALSDVGETPIYYHLLALCCRLKGNVDDALCHLNVAIKKFGDRSSFGEGGDAGKTEEQKSSTACAIACAAEALKFDRQAGRAWALLSNVVKPSARRLHCENMANVATRKDPKKRPISKPSPNNHPAFIWARHYASVDANSVNIWRFDTNYSSC